MVRRREISRSRILWHEGSEGCLQSKGAEDKGVAPPKGAKLILRSQKILPPGRGVGVGVRVLFYL